MLKMKNFLIHVIAALSMGLMIQYFFSSKEKSANSTNIENKSFIAPESPSQVIEPLDFDVNFYDQKSENLAPKEKLTKIITSYGELNFSNFGGVLSNLSYNLKNNSNHPAIDIIQSDKSKEPGAFLVALNGFDNTPYYYELIENQKEGDLFKISYKGESQNAIITKQFIIDNNKPEIKLTLTLEPKNNKKFRTRIFLPGPISDNLKEDFNKAIVYTENNSLEKKQLKNLNLFGKEYPSLFGLENHYFTTLLINDKDKFAKRAYFKVENAKKATAIFESDYIKNKSSWNLSFYCGPKELNYLSKTDGRLIDLLEYGWFSFTAKPILYLLNFIYSIFKSYGLAIILITILTRIIILPFTYQNETYKRKNIEMQKKLRYIEQTYKHDPEILAREKLEVLKKYGMGINILLPILVQMPIFIGLSKVINSAIELYKTPFLWIKDLSSPDQYYIMPILFGLGILLQVSQTSANARHTLITILMVIVIAAFSSNFSAGLTLYLSLSTILGVTQTYIQRRLKI